MKENNKLVTLGIIGGFIASLCCVGPVLLVMFGLSGVSFALSIGKYSWFFLTLGIAFLIIALFIHFKKKNSCNIKGIKKNWKQIMITFVIMVAVLVIVKYWLAAFLAKLVYG